ncbi:hypothetical protein LTR78_004540 [Recurvomyces mirabilis]|uniref:CCHC-type domain-containing protein n=1 Tax=Recurvomyces mirabilis TaxID=574656 RepID=A0AAE1C2A2_9PEZI|nr:hypothetical protein LTR78_004540 [Recurvomyces mirabilis]KAK5152966.1 hypothetical protein LTS14_008074 [Recurvomyces mirabilis]
MDDKQNSAARLERRLPTVRLPIDFAVESILYAKDLIILVIAPLGCLACWALAIVWIYTIQVIPELLLLTADLLQACVGVGVGAKTSRAVLVEELDSTFEEATVVEQAQPKSTSDPEKATATSPVNDVSSAQIAEGPLGLSEDLATPTEPEHNVARYDVVSTVLDSANLNASLRARDEAFEVSSSTDMDDILSWSSGDEDFPWLQAGGRSHSQERTVTPERPATPERDHYAADRRDATSSKLEQRKASANNEWVARVTGVKPEQKTKPVTIGSGITSGDFAIHGANIWQTPRSEADTAARRPQPAYTKEQLAEAAAAANGFARAGNKQRPGSTPRTRAAAARTTMRVYNCPLVKPATFVPPRPQPSMPTSAPPIKSVHYSAENLPPHKRKQQAARHQKSSVDHGRSSGKSAEPIVNKNMYEVLCIDGSAPNSPNKLSPKILSKPDPPLPAMKESESKAGPGQVSALNAMEPVEAQMQPEPMTSPTLTIANAHSPDIPEDEVLDNAYRGSLSYGNAPALVQPVAHTMSIDALMALNTQPLQRNEDTSHVSEVCTMCGGKILSDAVGSMAENEVLTSANCRAIGPGVQDAQLIVGKARTAFHRRKPSPTCVRCGGEGHRSVCCPIIRPFQDQSDADDLLAHSDGGDTTHDNIPADIVGRITRQAPKAFIEDENVVNTPYTRYHRINRDTQERSRFQVMSDVATDLLEQDTFDDTAVSSKNNTSSDASAHKQLDLLDLDCPESASGSKAVTASADRRRRTSSQTPNALPFFAPSSREGARLGSNAEQANSPEHTLSTSPFGHDDQTCQPQPDYDGWFGGPITTYSSSDDCDSAFRDGHNDASQDYYTNPAVHPSYNLTVASPPPPDFVRPARSAPVTIKLPTPQKVICKQSSPDSKDSQIHIPRKLTMAELFGSNRPAEDHTKHQPVVPSPSTSIAILSIKTPELPLAKIQPVYQASNGNSAYVQGRPQGTAAHAVDSTVCDTAGTCDHLFEMEHGASEASSNVPGSSDSASAQDHAKAFDVAMLSKAGRDDNRKTLASTPVHSGTSRGTSVPDLLLDNAGHASNTTGEDGKTPGDPESNAKMMHDSQEALAVEVLGAPNLTKSMKQQKREAREDLIMAWWTRENARKQVKGTFSLERIQALETATRGYGQSRATLISLMGNSELNEKDAKRFPVLTIHDMGEPKNKPPAPDTTTSSTASKSLQTERVATPEPATLDEEKRELLEQTETALNHYYDAVDFFKGPRPQGRQNKSTLVTLGKARAERARKYYQKKLVALSEAFPGAADKAGYPAVDELEVPHTGVVGAPCRCRWCRRHQMI